MHTQDRMGNEAINAEIQAEGLTVELICAQHCLSRCVQRPARCHTVIGTHLISNTTRGCCTYVACTQIPRSSVLYCALCSGASSVELPLMLGRVQFEV
jgi:hypothetical protein